MKTTEKTIGAIRSTDILHEATSLFGTGLTAFILQKKICVNKRFYY